MEENKNKQSEEILAEIYRNCQLALESIADILPAVDDDGLRAEILAQHEEYERVSAQAARLAKDKGVEVKEPNPIKKAMMWGSIKMSTFTDNSRAHIAEMMINGTVMGITSLRTSQTEAYDCADDRVLALLEELIELEEGFEKRLKEYL